MSTYRFDSLTPTAGAFFDQDLRSIRRELLEDTRAPLNGFSLIPQATDVSPYATSYEHRMYEGIGVAKFISDYAEDLPNVDISARAELFNVRDLGAAYKYSIREIEASAALSTGLDRKKAKAARDAIEQAMNRVMFFGSAEEQLFGWVNYPYIPRRVVSFAFDASAASADVLAEMHALPDGVFLQTQTSRRPDVLAVATSIYNYVKSTPWSLSTNGATDKTILKQFLETNHFIKEVIPVHELEGAGPNGEHLMIAYTKDETVFSHKLVEAFTQRAPQEINLAIITNCYGKTGGIAADKPLEMAIAEVPAS